MTMFRDPQEPPDVPEYDPVLDGAAELISDCVANLAYAVGMGNAPSHDFCYRLAAELQNIFKPK